jgi:uncharacterized protein YbdZ (MbtH family)
MKSFKFLVIVVLSLTLLALALIGTVMVSAQQAGSISGTVFCDANYNFQPDPGEGIDGVPVTLWDDPNCDGVVNVLDTLDTANGGQYSFSNLAVGSDIVSRECYRVGVDPSTPELGTCNFIPYIERDPTGVYYSVYLYSPSNIDVIRDFPFQQVWDKTVNGQPWVPDLAITVQTSDTIQIVDSLVLPLGRSDSAAITQEQAFTLTETWDPARLDLVSVEWNPLNAAPITSSGMLTWRVPWYQLQVPTATLTKTFHVEPCTWASTVLQEDLYQTEIVPQLVGRQLLLDQRPVVVNKTAPVLWIDSTYDSEVSPGSTATFTLSYGNDGGYENAVMIRNDFPPEAPFDSAVPAPDREAPDGSWVEWDVDDLSTGTEDSIDVTVAIQAGLSPSTTMVITDDIYNHVNQVAGETVITFHILQPPLSLGDFVWYDTNQDGIQDTGEPGVQGIDVDLYARECSGQAMATETTDANGHYLFQDLSPGIYCLQFSGIPAGWSISPQDQGSDDTVDSDADPVTAQIPNIDLTVDDLNEDMGVYAQGSIGDTVFCDANYNGQFDAGEGIAGVAVDLFDDPDCAGAAGNLLATQDTVGDGQYLFSSLMVGPPGGPPVCYVVSVDETDPALGACNNPITPLSYAVSLDADAPDSLDNDFGFSELFSLGDLVWNDLNANGIQDPGEPGVQGVVATLYTTADCSGGNPLATDTTDVNGVYGFTGLEAGPYCIAFSNIPAGWEISPQDQGSNDAVDSDADPATGMITNINLTASDLNEDMGIFQPPTPTPIPTVAPQAPPPVVPEASTLILLGGAISGLAGYAGLQLRARRRKSK